MMYAFLSFLLMPIVAPLPSPLAKQGHVFIRLDFLSNRYPGRKPKRADEAIRERELDFATIQQRRKRKGVRQVKQVTAEALSNTFLSILNSISL